MPTQSLDMLRFAIAHGDERSDAQLLDGFIRDRDATAIEAIIRRHGPMIWGVCRRALSHHDAEDAFQSTFLVLARRAESVRPAGLLGNWLYGVARRTALKARIMATKRQQREASIETIPTPPTPVPAEFSDLRLVLDRELDRLPAKYRAPVILCDLQDKTRQEAARQLGWPEGTVCSRLFTGRKKLAARLARRGLALSGGALTVTLVEEATARVPMDLVASTISLLSELRPPSAHVAVLTNTTVKAMSLSKMKLAGLTMIAAAVLAGSAYFHSVGGEERPSKPAVTVTADPKPMILKGHTAGAFDVVFSPDGKRIVSTGLDKTVRVWDAESGKELHTLTSHEQEVLGVAFEPDGKHFVTVATDGWSGPNFANKSGEIKRWNLESGKEVRNYSAPGELPTLGVAVSPDGKRMAVTGGANGALARVTLLDIATGDTIWVHEKDLMWPYTPVDFSADGKKIVTAGGKREVNVLDAETGKELFSTSALPDPALAARFHPSGDWVVAGGIGKPPGLRVFDAKNGKRLPTIETDLRWVRDLQFNRSGKLLAAAAIFGVRIFDTASGKTVLELKDFKVNVYGVAFNPEGDRLAVAADDKLVHVFALKTSEPASSSAPAKEPAKPETLDARKTASAFLDAAIAGKVEDARAHADPNTISENKVKDFQEAGIKRVELSIVLADDAEAMAISETIELEKDRKKAHLLLYLRKKDGRWRVRDVDFEPSEEAFRKQRDFLEGHPEAKTVKVRK
jgi:RNA polymerase sigma factor (sigma-70 family)